MFWAINNVSLEDWSTTKGTLLGEQSIFFCMSAAVGEIIHKEHASHLACLGCKDIPYILESNPHLSFNRPLPTRQTDLIILDVTNALTVIQLMHRV